MHSNTNNEIFPFVKIEKIEILQKIFDWNTGLRCHKDMPILGEKFLIHTLQQKNYNFDFTIVKEKKGKPYFLYNNKLHFSISNSQDYIAIAICDRRIGIDIEHLRTNKKKLAERLFHTNEIQYLNSIKKSKNNIISQIEDQNLSQNNHYNVSTDIAFTQLWTIKEAYVKMTGTGIAGNFSTIDLSPQHFNINQDYYKNLHRIVSYQDITTELFVSICVE
ncbi:MAG: 4'-phosphopantetheinyl transferase family protein [Bacteroidales bacterium]